MAHYPDEVRRAARSLYLRGYKIKEIATTLNVPKRTVYHWAQAEDWEDLVSHQTAEEAIQRRLALLAERDGKSPAELKEIDCLVSGLERLTRLAQRPKAAQEHAGDAPAQSSQRNKGRPNKRGKGKTKNDVSHLTADDFQKLHQHYFQYQLELYANRHHRNRQILKSRQIGATWYFAQEAFENACLTGDNQIFLSATRAQADVFREYIVNIAGEAFDLELKGKDKLQLHTAHGPATLYFLSNNSKSAQSYHGHVYIDEFFWICRFNDLYKVATGMAAHKKWRRTLFSTPSAVTHEAYDLWTGERFQKRYKKKRAQFPSFKESQGGVLCPDNTWRKIITLEDAEAGGCDLFDVKELKLEYSPDEFRNLFMCEFVDDTWSVFRLADLELCPVDPDDEWPDFTPGAQRPFGNAPVWGGYDPSRSRDDASFVILAPPLESGGRFRVLERYKWTDKSFTWQAERIKELTERYNFEHIGVDTTGPGIGVYDAIKGFFPMAQSIHYSVQAKNMLVLKAKDVIENGRLEWNSVWSDIGHAFLTIRQGLTNSGQMTYSAGRTANTGHADVAWAIMHALAHEPLTEQKGGRVVVS
ncbi:terminase family protein [Desulfobaculum senezii]